MDTLHVSTSLMPPGLRLEYFREVFGREILRIEMEPAKGAVLDVDMTLCSLSGLGIAAGSLSPMTNRLTAGLVNNDDLVLVMMEEGSGTARQRGREADVRAGQAVLTANGDPASFSGHSNTHLINLRLSRAAMASRRIDADASVLKPITETGNDALRLLRFYVRAVASSGAAFGADLERAAADHIHDLAALALGAGRDAAEIAKGRGARTARLQAIKADIVARAASDRLSLDAIAARHGLSSRYVRGLFRSEDTTFTDFVLEQRLKRAHKMLCSPRYASYPIGTIAYEAGFGDISHFNHRFRKAYGATPSDIRQKAIKPRGDR